MFGQLHRVRPNCPAGAKRTLIVVLLLLATLIMSACGNISEWQADMERRGRILEWPSNELTNQLPAPDFKYGFVEESSEDSISVVVTRMKPSDFEEYVSQCKNHGFTREADDFANEYFALNADDYRLTLAYLEEDGEMQISISVPLYPTEIEIDCREKTGLDEYGASVSLDGKEIGWVEDGEISVFSEELRTGTHALTLQTEGEESKEGSVEIEVLPESSKYRFEIACESNQVTFSQVAQCKAPLSAADAEGQDYEKVAALYREAGFEKVSSEGSKVLSPGEKNERFTVQSVSVGGDADSVREGVYFVNDEVFITYCDFKEINPPAESSSFKGRMKKGVVSDLEEAGFLNVTVKLVKGEYGQDKNGEVRGVSIGGKSNFGLGDTFAPDDKVVVTCFEIKKPKANQTRVPFSSDYASGLHYEGVVEDLKAAGFKNVKTKRIYDQENGGWFSDVGQVEKVTIAGSSKYSKGDIFKKKAKIVVSYHELKWKNPKFKWKKRTVKRLVNDLKGNAMMADEVYTDAYLQVTGVVDRVDENGTFYLVPKKQSVVVLRSAVLSYFRCFEVESHEDAFGKDGYRAGTGDRGGRLCRVRNGRL